MENSGARSTRCPATRRISSANGARREPFAAYKPEQLREYAGCRLMMGHMTIMYWVRREAKTCRAENRAVAYEITEILGNSAGMKEGTMGFDASGKHIAGENGARDFRRIAAVPR